MASNKVTNLAQFKKLIDEMEKRPYLANNFKKGLHTIGNEWDELANQLNLIGPPMRATLEWQRVWRDVRQKVKKKIMHNQAEVNATGGRQFNQILLTPNEEAVANLLNFGKLANPAGKIAGCSQTVAVNLMEPPGTAALNNAYYDNLNAEIDLEPQSSKEPTQKPAERRSRPNDKNARNEFLIKQTLIQGNLYRDVSTSLGEIKSYLKDSARYLRKNFELNEKLFKLFKSKIEKKESLMEQQHEIQELDLQIKKKKLENFYTIFNN